MALAEFIPGGPKCPLWAQRSLMAAVSKPKSEVNPRLLVRPQKSQPTCCNPLEETRARDKQRQGSSVAAVSALRPSVLVHTEELRP